MALHGYNCTVRGPVRGQFTLFRPILSFTILDEPKTFMRPGTEKDRLFEDNFVEGCGERLLERSGLNLRI